MRPLHWSALHGHLALLQSLLEMRADATAENHQKQTHDRNVAEKNGWKTKKWKNINLGVSFWFEGLFCLLLENHPKPDTWPTKCVRIFWRCENASTWNLWNWQFGCVKKFVVQSILTPAGLINSLQKIVCICKIMASLAKPHRTCFGSSEHPFQL